MKEVILKQILILISECIKKRYVLVLMILNNIYNIVHEEWVSGIAPPLAGA